MYSHQERLTKSLRPSPCVVQTSAGSAFTTLPRSSFIAAFSSLPMSTPPVPSSARQGYLDAEAMFELLESLTNRIPEAMRLSAGRNTRVDCS